MKTSSLITGFSAFCLLSALGAPSEELDNMRGDVAAFSAAVAQGLPDGWYVWLGEAGPSVWFRGRHHICMSFRKDDGRYFGKASEGGIVFLPRDYSPKKHRTRRIMPGILIGRTTHYQIFAWCDAGDVGWVAHAEDIIRSLSRVTGAIEWNPNFNEDLTTRRKVRADTSGEEQHKRLADEWERQAGALKRYHRARKLDAAPLTGEPDQPAAVTKNKETGVACGAEFRHVHAAVMVKALQERIAELELERAELARQLVEAKEKKW